ncbi:hypothetical protein E2986_12592, partial [Frieseomelitta varia]
FAGPLFPYLSLSFLFTSTVPLPFSLSLSLSLFLQPVPEKRVSFNRESFADETPTTVPSSEDSVYTFMSNATVCSGALHAIFARPTGLNQFLLLVSVPLYDGEQLNLTRITRNEMGAYLCIATNGVPPTVSKRITVDVEFSPMIFVPNQLVGAPPGTNVTIDCHTEAYPRAMSYWFLGDEMILSNEKYTTNIMENSYRAYMRLTIRNLQDGDFGNYRCISKNSLGETEGSIRLYAIPKPSAAPKATEIKSSANKEGRPSTPSPAKRPTTVWPSSYNTYYTKRTERPPPPSEERVERPEQKLRGGQSTGSFLVELSINEFFLIRKICRIVTTAGDLELEVSEDDIEELTMEHESDLTTEELQELLNEEHQETHRDVFSSEKEKDERGPMPTSAIKDLLKKFGKDVRTTILEWHPNEIEVNRLRDFCNSAVTMLLITSGKILKKREKQSTLDRFFNEKEKT